MKKILMIAALMVATLSASAQNTLRENGSFTLQPKVGIDFGSLSGSWTRRDNIDRKTRVGLIAGFEGEYYANEWLGIAAGLNYAQQGWKFNETQKLDFINIPVTADFYVAKGLALKAGVQFGFLTTASTRSTLLSLSVFLMNTPTSFSTCVTTLLFQLSTRTALQTTSTAAT